MSNSRLPKAEYFQLRYTQAVAAGLTSKAAYYKGRLEQLSKPAPDAREMIKQSAIEKATAKFATLDESGLLVEYNRIFKKATADGISVQQVIHFLTQDCKQDDTLVMHSMTF